MKEFISLIAFNEQNPQREEEEEDRGWAWRGKEKKNEKEARKLPS